METKLNCQRTKHNSFKVCDFKNDFAFCIFYDTDIMEAKILGSNLIHTHHWKSGDMLVLNNPSLAHIAGPGSQGSFEVTGLRLMHRTTVAGKKRPSKRIDLEFVCANHAPFENSEYCLFSLKVRLII